MSNTNFSTLVTRTLQNHGDEVFDQVSTNNALLWMLKKAGNIKVVGGGRTFTHPLRYQLNSSFQMYGKFDPISTLHPDTQTRAEYAIKIAAGSLVLSKLEEAMNAGDKEKLLDYADEVREDAVVSMTELLGDQVFGSGATDKDFDGLQQQISDSPSTQTDVGGIDPSAQSYWRNQVDTATVSAFNTSSAGIKAMDSMLLSCTFGRMGPRAVFTTKAIWSLYQVGQAANIRYTHTDLADAGFKNLDYAGIPVLYDDNCPASHMYFVDTDGLKLQVLRQGNNKITQFRPSINQLTDVALMYLFGNITNGSRRTNGVITSITG